MARRHLSAFAGELATAHARKTIATDVLSGPLVGNWGLALLRVRVRGSSRTHIMHVHGGHPCCRRRRARDCFQRFGHSCRPRGTGSRCGGGSRHPRSGTVTLTSRFGTVSVGSGPHADGVRVRILHNGLLIWPASGYQLIQPGGSVVFPALPRPVTAGDLFSFEVEQNGTAAYDTTTWVPSIGYLP